VGAGTRWRRPVGPLMVGMETLLWATLLALWAALLDFSRRSNRAAAQASHVASPDPRRLLNA
jgi:hypothetical protein